MLLLLLLLGSGFCKACRSGGTVQSALDNNNGEGGQDEERELREGPIGGYYKCAPGK